MRYNTIVKAVKPFYSSERASPELDDSGDYFFPSHLLKTNQTNVHPTLSSQFQVLQQCAVFLIFSYICLSHIFSSVISSYAHHPPECPHWYTYHAEGVREFNKLMAAKDETYIVHIQI